MANSRFDYHKKEEASLERQFEPRFFIVIRLHLELQPHLLEMYHQLEPKGLSTLIKISADQVVKLYRGDLQMVYRSLTDVCFIIGPESDLFTRRISKLVSMISAVFGTCYDTNWHKLVDMRKDHDDLSIRNCNWYAKALEFSNMMLVFQYLKWLKHDTLKETTSSDINHSPSPSCQSDYVINKPDKKREWKDVDFMKEFNELNLIDNQIVDSFKKYELDGSIHIHKGCYIIVRVDGDKFHHYSTLHNFHKPNDKRALDLMVDSAKNVMYHFKGDVVLAYGASDEFSFLIRYNSDLLSRDITKILSVFAIKFANYYNRNWDRYFACESEGKVTMQRSCALFDSKIRKYANILNVIDYFRWRQTDCHINNLYNTTLHSLTGQYQKHELIPTTVDSSVELHTDGKSHDRYFALNRTPIRKWIDDESKFLSSNDATTRLYATYSSDKHDILFKEFGINYNQELEQFKKGTIIVDSVKSLSAEDDADYKSRYKHYSVDITRHKDFWEANSHIFEDPDRDSLTNLT